MNVNSYGVKLNKNMINDIMDKIFDLSEKIERMGNLEYKLIEEAKFMWLVGANIGFKKFSSIEDIKRNRSKFERILMNESAFSVNLGLSLMNFFGLKAKNAIIYEDLDGAGRTIKERISSKCEGHSNERILSFIPTFENTEDLYTVDTEIKKWNRIAETNYDIIEGRYYSNAICAI